ncbi:unnamed protein product [Notodromas monacha]|uniref:Uncharacterized protein n=1 Tax=Notodromas monacha TaxID=399045 RepID=A0A7R9BJG0_9CRUS|nr:unnamed protein product [Notodromas monacha]CAG0916626.1 unnamed protein product [Notodromas monacha]
MTETRTLLTLIWVVIRVMIVMIRARGDPKINTDECDRSTSPVDEVVKVPRPEQKKNHFEILADDDYSGKRRERSSKKSSHRSRKRDSSSSASPPRAKVKNESKEPEKRPAFTVIKLEGKKPSSDAVRQVESDGFTPRAFVSSRTSRAVITIDDDPDEMFQTRTKVEEISKVKEEEKKETECDPEGIVHPNLFGNQAERDARWKKRLVVLRQRLCGDNSHS